VFFSGDLPLHDIYLQFIAKVWQNKLMIVMCRPNCRRWVAQRRHGS